MEKDFVKYKERGSMHWRQMMSRSIRKSNAHQQARYGWVLRSVGDSKGKKVLDLGCGDGALSYWLARAGAQVTGVDNEPLGIQLAKENLHSVGKDSQCTFVVASAYELPFPDQSFDFVVSSEVIEHVQHPEKMVAEARRVLKPGGKFVLTTPYRLTEFPNDPNHVKEYFPTEMEKMLKADFRTVEIKLTHHILWTGLFGYTFRRFKRRQFGYWFINALTLWFGHNPFMIEYPNPTKLDRFTQILAIAS
jgi:ubiquinone/menaquinone biosynthesis C-methylase UbiE